MQPARTTPTGFPKIIGEETLRLLRIIGALIVALSASLAGYAQEQKDPDELLAGVLNRNGLLCSRVLEKRPGQGLNQLEVTCIEYRGGTRRVRYILDLSTMKAVKAE